MWFIVKCFPSAVDFTVFDDKPKIILSSYAMIKNKEFKFSRFFNCAGLAYHLFQATVGTS